jgi:hypothetical protein
MEVKKSTLFGNKVQRKIFGPKREKYKEEFHDSILILFGWLNKII